MTDGVCIEVGLSEYDVERLQGRTAEWRRLAPRRGDGGSDGGVWTGVGAAAALE